jgi:hypothetical protein
MHAVSKDRIDYDRGVKIKIIGRLNMEVFMYKDDPGVFIDSHGNPVPLELAAEAGYDVPRLEKLRIKKQRLHDAAKFVEEDMGADESSQVTIFEQDGFRVVGVGSGLHFVEDPDGNCLTPSTRLALEPAKALALKMAKAMVEAKARKLSAVDGDTAGRRGGRPVPVSGPMASPLPTGPRPIGGPVTNEQAPS